MGNKGEPKIQILFRVSTFSAKERGRGETRIGQKCPAVQKSIWQIQEPKEEGEDVEKNHSTTSGPELSWAGMDQMKRGRTRDFADFFSPSPPTFLLFFFFTAGTNPHIKVEEGGSCQDEIGKGGERGQPPLDFPHVM